MVKPSEQEFQRAVQRITARVAEAGEYSENMHTLLPKAEFDSLRSDDRAQINEYCGRRNRNPYDMFARFNAGPDE